MIAQDYKAANLFQRPPFKHPRDVEFVYVIPGNLCKLRGNVSREGAVRCGTGIVGSSRLTVGI